jgi:hypothetical protein
MPLLAGSRVSVSSPQAVCGNAGLDGPAGGTGIEPVAVDASCVVVRKERGTEAEAWAAGARIRSSIIRIDE